MSRAAGHSRRLTIPVALAVSALAVSPACTEEGTDDTTASDTGGTTSGTTGTGTVTTDAATDTTDAATDTTGAATATTEGEAETRATDDTADTGSQFYCETIEDETECEEHPDCMWEPRIAICLRDCSTIDDEATCNEVGLCFWDGETCQFGGI